MTYQFVCSYQNKFIYKYDPKWGSFEKETVSTASALDSGMKQGVNADNMLVVSVNPNQNLDIDNNFEVLYHNDKYTKYKGNILHNVGITEISNMTEKEVNEFVKQKFSFKMETYDHYINNVYPIIKEQKFPWIDNIMNKTSEADKILYEDDTFVLLPDLKWSQTDLNDFYCLTIAKDKELRSIRDLTDVHLDFLHNMYKNSMTVIKEKFGIDRSELRCYFHYHPTYFRIHVHMNLIKNQITEPVETIFLLDTVINNIKLDSNYYQKIGLLVKHV